MPPHDNEKVVEWSLTIDGARLPVIGKAFPDIEPADQPMELERPMTSAAFELTLTLPNPGNVSRKRLVKLLMSRGVERNAAQKTAEYCRRFEIPYWMFARSCFLV